MTSPYGCKVAAATSDRIRSGLNNAWILGGTAAVLFGATTPIAKLLLREVPPLTLAGLLYLGAACTALPAATVGASQPPRRGDMAKVAGAVLAGGVIAPALLLSGLRDTPASTASLLLNLELVATAVLARLVFKEHVGRRAATGLAALAAAGVLLTGLGGGMRSAAVLIVGACVAWALDNNLTATSASVSPAHITLAKGAVAGATNLTLGLVIERPALHVLVVVGAMAVGAIGYGLSIILWVSSARQLGAARSQGVFATAPFVGMVLGWVLTGESVQSVQLAAMAVMAAGVVAVVTSSHEHSHRHLAEVHTHRHRHDDGHHDHTHATPPSGWHTHEHVHPELVHSHTHFPDESHRHAH